MTDEGQQPASPDRARLAQLVLEAVAGMARRSVRSQADLGAALRKAGLALPPAEQAGVLALLSASGLIENLIPLSDGALLLTVTAKGLVAGRRRG